MDSLPKHPHLEWPPNALRDIRKIHNLDKPGRIEDSLAILKEWIQKQDHFTKKDFSDDYLERYLISCKGSVEKTKKQIDRLCTLKTLLPHFFTANNVKTDLKDALSVVDLLPMPKVTQDFYRVIIHVFHCNKLTERSILQYFQYNIFVCEYSKAYDYSNGYIIVMDMQNFNFMELLSKLNPILLQQYLGIITEGLATRLKAIHLLTQSKGVDLVVKMTKQFLSRKITDRIFVHKTLKELHKVVPKDMLPKDYGGKEKSVEELTKCWIEQFNSDDFTEYIKMMNNARTDERLRRADKFNEEYMGMAGAFRNLEVD